MARPLIGIVSSLDDMAERYSVDPAYVRAVESAGGTAIIVPYSADPIAMLELVDGVILHGGGNDIDPTRYGGPDARARRVHPERDAFEFELVTSAVQRDHALLGVCRGAQVMNVALGGSLYTDLRTDLVDVAEHRELSRPLEDVAHEVQVLPGTTLARLFGVERIGVNSMHHQAIRELGADLQVSAIGNDGVVEAVEAVGRRFAIGVQWHPERRAHLDPFSSALFKGLVTAASA